MNSSLNEVSHVSVVDSHTGGEPTRIVVSGGPRFVSGTLAEKAVEFRKKHDHLRNAIVNEPRGSDVLVGGMLLEPSDPSCCAAVIFFNNVGVLGMCGHGTIGLIVTLAYLGRIGPGSHRLETPVGVVTATLKENGSVAVTNVPSYRKLKDLQVNVPGIGPVKGDLAWGGNWFFLVEDAGWGLGTAQLEALTDIAWRIRQAVNDQGYPEVDHVEIFGPPAAGGDGRNFVLCPGKAYDRSPCGTGTSAKLACLAADGALSEGEKWIQESIIGSKFEGTFRWLDRARGEISPTIVGTAFVTGEAKLRFDPADPFCWGIRTGSSESPA